MVQIKIASVFVASMLAANVVAFPFFSRSVAENDLAARADVPSTEQILSRRSDDDATFLSRRTSGPATTTTTTSKTSGAHSVYGAGTGAGGVAAAFSSSTKPNNNHLRRRELVEELNFYRRAQSGTGSPTYGSASTTDSASYDPASTSDLPFTNKGGKGGKAGKGNKGKGNKGKGMDNGYDSTSTSQPPLSPLASQPVRRELDEPELYRRSSGTGTTGNTQVKPFSNSPRTLSRRDVVDLLEELGRRALGDLDESSALSRREAELEMYRRGTEAALKALLPSFSKDGDHKKGGDHKKDD